MQSNKRLRPASAGKGNRYTTALPLFGLIISLMCGCVETGPKLADYGVSGGAVELTSAQFFSQSADQGAPAALASVMSAQQLPVSLEALLTQFNIAHEGPFEQEVVTAAGTHALVPYVLHSHHLDLDVVHEVQAGNPVMVLLRRGIAFVSSWEFAVVIGVDPQSNLLTLRSGGNANETMSFGEFLSAWKDSEHWAMVALKPEQLPVTVDVSSTLDAIRPLVKSGHADIAARALAGAAQRWPEEVLIWEALGDARHVQHDFRGSSEAFIEALKLQPQNNIVRNNLAYVLLERNCADQAEGQIKQAIETEADPQQLENFRGTLYRVMQHDGPSVVCPEL